MLLAQTVRWRIKLDLPWQLGARYTSVDCATRRYLATAGNPVQLSNLRYGNREPNLSDCDSLRHKTFIFQCSFLTSVKPSHKNMR